jgi:hypothetical protein
MLYISISENYTHISVLSGILLLICTAEFIRDFYPEYVAYKNRKKDWLNQDKWYKNM